MVWVVDKRIVRHVLERDGQFVEIPVRVKFEYEQVDGRMIDGTLETEKLYNEPSVLKIFPGLDAHELEREIEATVQRDIREYIALGR